MSSEKGEVRFNGQAIGDEAVVFQDDQTSGVAKDIRPRGTLDDWKSTVGRECIGKERLNRLHQVTSVVSVGCGQVEVISLLLFTHKSQTGNRVL